MPKKIFLLSLVTVATLGLLKQQGIVTHVQAVDSLVVRLDSSLRQYVRAFEANSGDQDPGRTPDLTAALRNRKDRPLRHFESARDPGTLVPLPAESDSPPTRSEGWIVQAGAFRDAANAERIADLLRERNSEPWMYRLDTGLYAVRIGPFGGRSLAEQAAAPLKAIIGQAPLVIRVGVAPD